MSFGAHYQYQKAIPVLSEGVYDIVLAEPFETTVGNYPVLRFPFLVKGMKEEVRPNYFDLFDCTDPNDKDKREMFQKNASRILDCFGMAGAEHFPPYAAFTGREGRVEIKKSKSGFTNVSSFYPKYPDGVENNNYFN